MPVDRGILDQQLQDLGESARWWHERELRDLPAVLYENERLLAITRGKLGRFRFGKRSWLMVVTDQRLICLRTAGFSGWRQVEVPARHIERVSLRVGPFRGRVVLGANGRTYRLLVPRNESYRLSSALSTLGATGRTQLPGFGPTRMVRRMVDHVLSLPAVAFSPETPAPPLPPAADTSALHHRINLMEEQMQQLQQQVDFLEDLLRKYQQPEIPR